MAEQIKSVMNYSIGDQFILKDLESRKLYINYEIDETLNDEITYHILRYNAEDKGIPVEKRKPILLYIASNGGSVPNGFSLIDTIINSKSPVYTINLAYQYLMGFLIGLAGHKRCATKHTTYLMHDGSNLFITQCQKQKIR